MAEVEEQDPSPDLSGNYDSAEIKSEFSLTRQFDGSDVTFIVEGKEIYASKLVLSMWSNMFKAMFRGSFEETTAKTITLPEKKYSDVLKLFELCHIPMDVVTDENVDTVLPLAEEYQMDQILDQCHRVLQSRERSIQNLLKAKRYRFTRLEELCMKFVKKTPLSNLSEDEFDDIDAEARADILMFKVKCLEPLLPVVKSVQSSLTFGKSASTSKCVACARQVTTLFRSEEDYIDLATDERMCFSCCRVRVKDIYQTVESVESNELLQQDE